MTSSGSLSSNPFNLLFVFLLSSIGIYGILLSGWSSNSRYAFLGTVRALIQIISYEIIFLFILIPIIFLSGGLSLENIVLCQEGSWNISYLLYNALIFIICLLAETNRAPFDLPEAEAELVAGYNVEYSSLSFAYFFLGEYSNILSMSLLFIIFC